MSGPVIETKELSKWFGEVVALNNLTLMVEHGVTGLLGPNGAGKSTFMKLALGLYRPSRGTMTVLGEIPRNNLRLLRRIGYCPESDQSHEYMSGREFVSYTLRYGGFTHSAAQRLTGEACERTGIAGRMDDPIGTYSRGMRQRIKLAQAIASDPELLFLDEPFTGLDPQGREEMYELVRALAEEGRAIIVSSHILHEVERVTSNVVMMHHGRLLADGSVRHIRELMDQHPHAITVDCTKPRAFASRAAKDMQTSSLEIKEASVILRTSMPAEAYSLLNDWILEGELGIYAVRSSDENLQAVFDYLVRK